jgi:exopolysaccharide biosynthesis polyprenyl glycosylphosphotransferase
MAEPEIASAKVVEKYESPEVIDIRVPVPRALISSPARIAKGQRFRRRAILSALAGLAATAASAAGARYLGERPAPAGSWLTAVAILSVVRLIVQWSTLRGDVRRTLGYTEEVSDAFRIATWGTLVALAFVAIAGPILALRTMLLIEWAFALVSWAALLVGQKAIATRYRQKGRNTRQVLVVGNTATSRRLIEQIERHPESGYRLAATIPYEMSSFADRHKDAGPRDGTERDLPSLIADLFVDDVVFSSSVPPHQVIRLLSLSHPELKIHQLSLSADKPVIRTGENLAGFPVTSLFYPALSAPNAVLKRIVDVVLAVVLLVLLLPVLLLALCLVKLTSKGPAIFRQIRIGHHGRPFTLYKLRTMRVDTDTSIHKEYVRQLMVGAVIEAGNGLYKMEQPGVTPLGRILRRLSIDEVPQLWNVVTGSMSIVGPRPPMPYEIPNHDSRQLRRLDVRPGLTGLWQVSGRNNVGYREMVELDLRYIDNWSLGGDLKIILRTPSAMFGGRQTS